VHRFEGYISGRQGDGLLAVFGYPIAHEDDVRRAVHAGLEIIHQVARLSEQAQRRFGIGVSVRVGVHRGLVYLDSAEGDVYGLGANVAARVSSLAPPGSVVVSDAVAPLVRASFELEGRPATAAKGVEGPIVHHQVLGERVEPVRVGRGQLVGRDREMAFLQKSWASALTGALNLPGVVFRGEPGIGKSRLAAAAAELADSSGAVVLELVGSPFHTDAGLHPVSRLVRAPVRHWTAHRSGRTAATPGCRDPVLFVGSGQLGAIVGTGVGRCCRARAERRAGRRAGSDVDRRCAGGGGRPV